MAWSDLPVDLLLSISSLLQVVDFLRFSVVCTSWNLALANNSHLPIRCRPSPWLLLPNNAGEASDTLTFRDLTIEDSHGRGSHHRFSSLSSHISGRRCIGSKDGWLVTLNKKNLQPRLFNPLTKAEMSLPSLLTVPGNNWHFISPKYLTSSQMLCDVNFQKIILSSNNSSGTAVVICRYKQSLALAKPGDPTWVLGPSLPPCGPKYYFDEFEDVCSNEEEQKFYAITHFSAVIAFDFNGQNIKLICPAIQEPYFDDHYYNNYIIFLSGTLIKIKRKILYLENVTNGTFGAMTTNINAFKFVSAGVASSASSCSKWIPITHLEDFSLFVGHNQSFSIHHTIAPEIRPNCIYFSDFWDCMSLDDFNHDAGLFDLHNDCLQYFHDSDSLPNWPPSIWFTPSFS